MSYELWGRQRDRGRERGREREKEEREKSDLAFLFFPSPGRGNSRPLTGSIPGIFFEKYRQDARKQLLQRSCWFEVTAGLCRKADRVQERTESMFRQFVLLSCEYCTFSWSISRQWLHSVEKRTVESTCCLYSWFILVAFSPNQPPRNNKELD